MKSIIINIGLFILTVLTFSCQNGDDIEPDVFEFNHTKMVESSLLSYNSLTNKISRDGIQEQQINNLTTTPYLYRISLKTSSEKFRKSIVGLHFDLGSVEYGIGKPKSGDSYFDNHIKMDKVLVSTHSLLLWTEIHPKMQKKELFIQCNTESEVVLWVSSENEINEIHYSLEEETSIELNVILHQVSSHEETYKTGDINDETLSNKYSWVEVDNQRWTTTDYSGDKTNSDGGKLVVYEKEPPKSNPNNGKKLSYDGDIILWEELLHEIPNGWHLPSVEEWDILLNRNMNSSSTRGNHLIWEYNGVNTYGMSLNFSETNVWPFNNRAGGEAFYLTSSKNESGVSLALSINEFGNYRYTPVNHTGLLNEVRGSFIRFVQNIK